MRVISTEVYNNILHQKVRMIGLLVSTIWWPVNHFSSIYIHTDRRQDRTATAFYQWTDT